MQITETRKAIIELIEPYMDKTLSEGCLLYHKFMWKEEKEIVQIIETKYGLTGISLDKKRQVDLDITGDLEYYKNKTIGNYNITAVLNYIKNNANNDIIGEVYKTKVSYDFENNVVDILGLETKDYTWRLLKQIKLPNKPLHLYTDEEDEQLLDLLLKLK